MTVEDIKKLLNAKVLCCEQNLSHVVVSACGCDMMSDVLAYVQEQPVLLTGLVNPQVIRTAEMMDFVCVVFVRNKKPDESMIKLAQERNILLMTTSHQMFEACGILYQNGLEGEKQND
ncbi:MAG: DRTGG domain-containing protein [Oscillospiraceae bacterium]